MPVPPFFMFGFERSGTTLLSMMVGAHPEIAVPFSTTGLWYRYWRKRESYGELADGEQCARLVADLLAEERIQLWDESLEQEEIMNAVRPGDFGSVVAAFHAAYAKHKGKAHWGSIDIATLFDMDLASRWFDDARFVHIVRDGRDVALSHERYAYGASNAAECAEQWINALHTNLKMGSILGPERYLVLRYEDLVLEPEPTLRRLCDFLAVGYSEAMLDYPQMVSKKVPESRRWLWPSLDKAPDRTNTYRWKTKMSAGKRNVFERVANDMLAALDYETRAEIPASLGVLGLELWYFLGRGHRFDRLARRLGLARRQRPG